MNLAGLDNVLWAAGFVGHAALFFVLIVRKRHLLFPVFTWFLAFQVLRTMLLFLVSRYGTKHSYFLSYWITGSGDYLFQVALIFEIARDVLRPTGRWVVDARRAFLTWGAVGCVGAAALAFQIGPPQSKGLDLWDVRITIFTSLLTCELFIAMSSAANRLGLQRRSYVVALGQGLTTWASVALLEDLGHVAFGWNKDFAVFVHIREIVYLSVLVYWIGIFWRPEKTRAPLSASMNNYLVALHQRVLQDSKDIKRTS